MIIVRFFSLFNSVPTNEALPVDDVPTDISSLLSKLVEIYPGLKEELLTPEGELERHILISVNGRAITACKGLKTELKAGDCVDFYLVLAGG
jgi:molybdopterin converting factor small subunit